MKNVWIKTTDGNELYYNSEQAEIVEKGFLKALSESDKAMYFTIGNVSTMIFIDKIISFGVTD